MKKMYYIDGQLLGRTGKYKSSCVHRGEVYASRESAVKVLEALLEEGDLMTDYKPYKVSYLDDRGRPMEITGSTPHGGYMVYIILPLEVVE